MLKKLKEEKKEIKRFKKVHEDERMKKKDGAKGEMTCGNDGGVSEAGAGCEAV